MTKKQIEKEITTLRNELSPLLDKQNDLYDEARSEYLRHTNFNPADYLEDPKDKEYIDVTNAIEILDDRVYKLVKKLEKTK